MTVTFECHSIQSGSGFCCRLPVCGYRLQKSLSYSLELCAIFKFINHKYLPVLKPRLHPVLLKLLCHISFFAISFLFLDYSFFFLGFNEKLVIPEKKLTRWKWNILPRDRLYPSFVSIARKVKLQHHKDGNKIVKNIVWYADKVRQNTWPHWASLSNRQGYHSNIFNSKRKKSTASEIRLRWFQYFSLFSILPLYFAIKHCLCLNLHQFPYARLILPIY